MKTETRNFKIVSAVYEKWWGSPLISGHTYSGDVPVATFVTFGGDSFSSLCGYGNTIAEAIISLEETIRSRLSDLCCVE
jgi:hypothetical protein